MESIVTQLQALVSDFHHLLPEGLLALGAILVLTLELIVKSRGGVFKQLFTIAVLGVVGYAIGQVTTEGVFFNGLLVQNDLIRFVKLLLVTVALGALIYPKSRTLYENGEYLFLVLSVLLGGLLIVQSVNLLTFYLSLELLSISSYILVAYTFKSKGFEAGIKYLLFGALSSGIMLYGMSLMYGLSGSLDVRELVNISSGELASNVWYIASIAMFAVGLLFKLSLSPMHIWAPDVYQAAPTPVVGYLSVLPKVAVFVYLFEFIVMSGLEMIEWDWKLVLSAISLLSMLVGNLSALRQTNLKRMMAYSSIAHAGFIVVGVIVGEEIGMQTMLFYLVVYALMNLGVFYFIQVLEANGLTDTEHLAGIGRSHVIWSVLGLIILVSLIGLPPTGGFTAKLLIFSGLWQEYVSSGENYLLWLLVLGLLNSAVSLFYYLKIPYQMLIAEGADTTLTITRTNVLVLTLFTISILIFFFKPDLLLNMLNQTSFAF